ncbi:protein of unknown function [Acidithiobacillus ferrivorans]|uniref:Uncharacterized protein n=1 Tax=Acidithiobacillus ferrivorans TaxID=160808 RepID=A0A060UPU6_9PROT|nr:hypothetical protein [Acidithiobacillus ferrivorans]CDQ10637.1 hypothetical protein AFERRI_400418 [Acidithiobacillus ferrivorans]SMH64666.1 protein of unknown function [Acidithiobacillus ferrivorans]
MVKEWGKSPAAAALLARLQMFLPTPSKGQALVDYLGIGYPLFGSAGGRWAGIREMGFPFLVTKDRMSTECYVRSICPEGRETVALEALASVAWRIPESLHIRVWTPQPKKKTDAPTHALPETVQSFQDDGVRAVEFMNAVKTADNSVRIPEMNVDVSRPFYEEWVSAMRSGEPYLCFLPERKPSRTVEGLRWFQSVFGLSFNGDNRKITEDDLQAKMGSGGDSPASGALDLPEAVWLWKVQEWARADVSARQSGVLSAGGWGDLQSGLGFRLIDAVKWVKKTDKSRSELVMNVGTHLLEMVRGGRSADVLEAMAAMREDDDLSGWWSEMNALDERVRQNGLNVTF